MNDVSLIREPGLDLQKCIDWLSSHGQLVTVDRPVDAKYELAGLGRNWEGKQAVLFTRVKDYSVPVLMGLYWNRALLAGLFGCGEQELPFLLADNVRAWQQNAWEPVVVESGPANEVVEEPDLSRLPVPTHALGDGGPYLSCCVVLARDPDTGVRNASVHRFMVTGKDRLTMMLDEGRHLRDYFRRAEEQGRPLEITINNGVDPTVYMAAMTPAAVAPLEADELGIACGLLGRPLQLLRSQTVAVEGVVNAQFILEAEILPGVREPEGPFAELTYYYGPRDLRWVVRVKKITRRREPVFHSLLPGREIAVSLAVMGEAGLFELVHRQVPEVERVRLTEGGCGRYHAVLQIRKRQEGTAKLAILAAMAAFPSLQMVTVVDEDVDITDPAAVEWAMCTRFRPESGLVLVPAARGHELNPATEAGVGTKIGFDATAPYPRPPAMERVRFLTIPTEG